MWLEQAVFYKCSWLPQQHMLSTKMHQVRQEVPPVQPLVPQRGQNRCATQEYRHRESTQWCSCTMLLQDYSWRIPVARGSVFYSKSCGRVFLPGFPKETGIPESTLLYSSSSQQHSHWHWSQGVTQQQQNQASEPIQAGWAHSSVACAFVRGISALPIVG